MQIKKIKCPKCNAVLEVKNSQNEAVKQITCPNCKSILQVKFPPEQEPLEAETYYATPKRPVADSGETQLAGNSYGETQLVSSKDKSSVNISNARLVFNEITYKLDEGLNVIGRKGNTSEATIQIATDDRYMSRQHCSITVTTLPDGSKKAVLSNYKNKNLTTIDGEEIETGDAIRLVNGNRITMGHTTVVFKL
jgi:phage FluMu protein Com